MPNETDSAQQRKGEYSPFKRRWRGRLWAWLQPLNKGRGNIPPSSTPPQSTRSVTAISAQQRKGEYSPFKMRTLRV